ncbi:MULTISPECIES: PAS domain S-box protein [Haloferax]|uniref:histidine kinase n=1 Tax=Haloferax marinum TaxID=2666143 RepID=A0A6A8G7G8_9EURY|nr:MULTISPECIES: PAS domain S-box protein [Haloferax]KAB1197916.1 PAS domain S-box protein [Haloferax sp. CBA1150]MRW96981.1 PAS domain S-box protein [Haloferax marinum]
MNESRVILVGEDVAFLAAALERRGFDVEITASKPVVFETLDDAVGGIVVDDVPEENSNTEFAASLRDHVGSIPVYVLVDDPDDATPAHLGGGVFGIERASVVEDAESFACRVESTITFSEQVISTREGESLYRTIVEQSHDAIFVAQDGEFQFWNRRLTDLTGRTDEELDGTTVLDVIHPDDREEVSDISERRRRGDDAPESYDVRIVDTDGQVHQCSANVQDIDYRGGYGVLVAIRDLTDQRRTEAQFRSLVELARDVVTLVGADGRIKYQSPSIEDVLGFDQDELVGTHIKDLVHPDDREMVMSAFEDAVEREDGANEPLRYRHRDADGSWRWLESVGASHTGMSAGGFVVTSRDVTERRTYEERLQHYETIVESIQQGAYVGDENGVIQYINEAASERIELSRDALVGKHVSVAREYGLLDDDQYTRLIDVLEEIFAGESDGERLELTLSLTTGEFVIEFAITPILDNTGAVAGVVGLSSDITERKRYEERLNALHASTRRLSAATSKEEVAEVVCEAGVDVLEYDLCGVLLYDESRDALVPTKFTEQAEDVFGEIPTLPRGTGLSWEVFESGNVRFYGEVDSDPRRYNPSEDVVEEFIVPIPDYGVFFVGARTEGTLADQRVALAKVLSSNARAALDRVEREQLLRRRERELARQNEQLESFASAVSHDLQNPLNVATGYLELAREEHDSDALQRVARAHDRMGAIIQDVLALAQNGQTVEEVERLSLETVARDAWETAAADAPKATLEIERDVPIDAHEGRLQQLLENLVSNAVRHGGDDVRVRIGPLDDRIGFYVEDDGPGISPDDRRRIFEAGYTTSDDGTGFGLNVVQSVVNAHGWGVWFSDSDDGGARFEITTQPKS